MSYLVLARKWRPMRFSEVVGQSHVTQTLANAIEMDRVAHAFLFSGVRGVGKTSLARILAKSLNCKEGPTPNPCGVCDSCKAVTAGTAVDVIEIDGASNNSVEDIRNLRETVPFRPVLGRYKVYVIDEVHMLSTSAFNALLKTLEEPPPHVKFIFATTESHKIPVTILSRCQRYDFRRIPTSAVIERLTEILSNEKISFEQGALALIGREAEGSMRDALSTLDQVLAACGDKITADSVSSILGVVERKVYYDLSRALLNREPRRCLEIVKETDRQGYEMTTFSKGLLEHLRNLVVAGVCKGDKAILDLADEEIAELLEQAGSVSADTLHRLFKHFSEAYESIVRSQHPKILLETALARIADLGELVPSHEILARLERLAAGGGASSGGGPANGGSAGGGFSSGARGDNSSFSRGPMRSSAPSPSDSVNSFSHVGSREASSVPPRVASPHVGAREVSSVPPRGASTAPRAVSASPRPGSIPQSDRDTLSTDLPSRRGPSPNVEISKERCRRIIEEMKQAKPAMASFLGCSRFETSADGISILFSKEYSSIAALAEERAPEMASYFQQHLGCEVKVSVRICDAADVPSAAKRRIEAEDRRREKEDRAVQHPLIRQIQSELGAKISGVQITEEPSACADTGPHA